MLDYLKPLKDKDFDFLTFLEGDVKNSIQIQGTEYQNRGEKVGGGIMGDEFHIILFRDHKTDKDQYDNVENFDAVLVDPLEYISQLIPTGWFGIIARKTTTSRPIVDKLLDKFDKM